MAISENQALEFFRSSDLIGLGMEADALRQRLHPEGAVTYNIDRTIHYAKFCGGYCSFCDVPDRLHDEPAREDDILDFEAIYAEVAATAELGGTGVSLKGGLHPALKLEWFERLFAGIRQRFPRTWLLCFSAPEILTIARSAGLTVRDTISRLRDAGLHAITGSGAETLEEWTTVHRTAHELGMRTSATMIFGLGESFEERVNHLEEVRRLQEATGGFTAFIPENIGPKKSASAGGNADSPTAVEYLKTLAISRLYLSNIENVQCSREAQGLKVLELGLRFGGNDAGSVLEESGSRRGNEEELRQVIRDAGFKPVQRDSLYTTCFFN